MESKQEKNLNVNDLMANPELRKEFYHQYVAGGLKNDQEFLNKIDPYKCPYCGHNHFHLEEKDEKGLNEFKCDVCHGKFTVLTNTVFQGMSYPVHDWHCFLSSLFQKYFLLDRNYNLFPKEHHEKFIALAKILMRISGGLHPFNSDEIEIHLFSYPDRKRSVDKPRLTQPSDYENIIVAFASDGIKLKTAVVSKGFADPERINNIFRNVIKEKSTLLTKPVEAFDELIMNNNLKSKIVLGEEDELRKYYDIYRGVKFEDEFFKFLKIYQNKNINLMLEYYLKVFELIERQGCTIESKICFIFALLLNNYIANEYEQFLMFRRKIIEQLEW